MFSLPELWTLTTHGDAQTQAQTQAQADSRHCNWVLMLHKCAKLVANLQGEREREVSWLRHCKCATCDMLHATCYMHWAWQRLVSHVWQVVNKRQIKCHCVLRAVTISPSLPLTHILSFSLCCIVSCYRSAVAHCSYATLHSRATAAWQFAGIICKSNCRSDQPAICRATRGWKLLDIIEIAHTQCCTRQVKPKAGFKAL